MAEQSHIPTSPACGQWETLLADALDGLLRPEDEVFFKDHMITCPACTAMYDEAKRGREWLDFLSLEPEAPEDLLDRILAQTGPGVESGPADGFGTIPGHARPLAVAGGGVVYPTWQKPGFMGFVRRFAEPRLMMTAAMAFFSIALTLNLTGVRLRDMRMASLRPQAVRSYMQRQLAVASTPVIRYYDHLRFVYEVQTRMRELRQSTEGQQTPNGESKHVPERKDGGSRLYSSPASRPDAKPDSPQESVAPVEDPDILESSFGPGYSFGFRSGSFGENDGERGTEWIA